MTERNQSLWDSIGAALSAACAVHCFLMPVALAFFPVLGFSFLSDEVFHPVLAASVAIIAGFAFSKGYRQHRSPIVVIIAIIGIGLLGFAALNSSHHAMTETGERIVTLFGSSFIVSAHFLNWKFLKRKHCAEC